MKRVEEFAKYRITATICGRTGITATMCGRTGIEVHRCIDTGNGNLELDLYVPPIIKNMSLHSFD